MYKYQRAILLLFVGFCYFVHATRGTSHFYNSKESPKDSMNIGLILPHTNFGVREYIRAINSAVSGLHRSRGPRLGWLKKYNFAPGNVHFFLMTLTPSPTGFIIFQIWLS